MVLFLSLSASLAQENTATLDNGLIKATFSDHGIVSLHDAKLDRTINFDSDNFIINANDQLITTKSLNACSPSEEDQFTIGYTYETDQFMVKVIYELKPGWRFVTKQIKLLSPDNAEYTVKNITVFQGSITNSIDQTYRLTDGRYGLSLRFKYENENAKPGYGCFVLVQNPFTKYDSQDGNISASYQADMKWKSEYGTFESDRFCIGTYPLTGTSFRADMAYEWSYIEKPDEFVKQGSQIDLAEIQAVTECARAFLLYHPAKSVRVHIGWCENDYQIDTSTPAGKDEYKRIMDQAAAVGCDYLLYTPSHSKLSPQSESKDAWGWENLLFLNLGPKIRKDQWLPPKDPIPADILNMLTYAKTKDLTLLAYVYPSLPFMQNPKWTQWVTSQGREPGGYTTVDTGLRSYQDWITNKLVDFYKYTGIGGYSFDHWWIAYEDQNSIVSSKYQQWYGCRRILENLRKHIPEILMDGRQQYHQFGTWTWLAGSYPHPTMSDEQPGSFVAIPDLSTDRVSAARQRYIASQLMIRDFCPIEILPGFITHQTQRSDANQVMRRNEYRIRDWDQLGWKYNLLSSIATAPFNHVINYLPARDANEFKAFSQADKAFFNYWLDFTDNNTKYFKKLKPIIGQPMVGRCDGTSAIDEDTGFIFVFNPNYRKLNATFKLDASIGLTKGERFVITEMYPLPDRILGCPEKGFYQYGDNVEIAMDGISAVALRIAPAQETYALPVLFNVTGKVTVISDTVDINNVTGQIGASSQLLILLPEEKEIKNVVVNSKKLPFQQNGKTIKCKVDFPGQYFSQAHQIGSYCPDFCDTNVNAEFIIPKRIFEQMKKHKKQWPIQYTPDDLIAPWIDCSRLLLYVQIADPYLDKEVTEKRGEQEVKVTRKKPIRKDDLYIEIDGKPAAVKEAYNGVYPYVERTAIGMYVDVSSLNPDVVHKIKVTLPHGLKPGQFQGIFFEHVENEYTSAVED